MARIAFPLVLQEGFVEDGSKAVEPRIDAISKTVEAGRAIIDIEGGPPVANAITDAPTVYADACYFVARLGNSVKLSFVETVASPTLGGIPEIKSKHVLNLVMPAEGYFNALKYLEEVKAAWDEFEAKGKPNGEPTAE